MFKNKIFSLLLSICIMVCSIVSVGAAEKYSNSFLDVRGVDVSSYISLKNSGVDFYDFDGNKLTDNQYFAFLKSCGINYVRIRIWNNPYDENGNGYGGGNCDLQNAVTIGKLASENSMKVFADFHLSDFWTDPSQQRVPKAWAGFNLSQKQRAVYDYVFSSLETLESNGVDVVMVQMGNEINSGMCGETSTKNVAALLKSGFSAVKDVDSKILKAVHYTNPEKNGYEYFAEDLNKYGVDYDVFASSYYSYWHGTTENLTYQLKNIADKYNKYVLCAETSYPFTNQDSDFFANNISGNETYLKYPVSVDGQKNAVRDVMSAGANVGEKGLGVFYWEPSWITVGTNSYQDNLKKWEQFGSGWESSYAAEYCDDKAQYHGGSSWDNQALFDKNGKPLNSLRVFKDFAPQYQTGDVNRDGKIDVIDSTLIQKYCSGIVSFDETQIKLADINCDGTVDITDSTKIQKYLANIINAL